MSIPFDIDAGSNEFLYNNAFYTSVIGNNLCEIIRREALPGLKKIASTQEGDRLDKALTKTRKGFFTLNNDIYVPMHNFKSCSDYFRAGAVAPIIHQIRVPTIVLHARDDLIIPVTFAPIEAIKQANSQVMLAFTKRGNHACHISGWFWPTHW